MAVATTVHGEKIDLINRNASRKRRRRNNIVGWCFLLPSFIGFIIFRFLPIVSTSVLGFTEWNLVSGLSGITFNGLSNYEKLFVDSTFVASIRNTVAFVLGSIPAIIILALIVAVIVNNKVYFRGVIRLMIYLPYISSLVAVSVVWLNLFSPSYGPINNFLRSLGVASPPGWTQSQTWALPALIIIYIWYSVGYYMVIFVAGLQGISQNYYEAAMIDGANVFQSFFRITLPLLSPTIFFAMITSIINSFQNFTLVQVMTEGGPGTSSMVLVYYIYRMVIKYSRVGFACSASVILFAILFVVTAAQMIAQKKWVHYE